MRIVVSGTHASGKSTLISDFATAHPEFAVLPDPFEELLDDSFDEPDAALFGRQLDAAGEPDLLGTRVVEVDARAERLSQLEAVA